jgi:ASPM-SPD-2-Hydin domain-containing protein/immunoglobulin I-set domain protein/Ig-like domain-containing protein
VAPLITTQPANQTTFVGQTATFSVVANGTSPLSYQWQKNGAAVSGATSSSYTTPAEIASDSGAQFTVVVRNSAGNVISNAATLTVNPDPVAPSITPQPASQTITAGQTATFSVVAAGTAPLSYQWQKNGTAITAATSSSYTTPATTTSDNGAQFTVVVGNSAGSVTSNAATLTVNPAPVAPSITTQPASQTVTAGQTATFSVSASGTAPLSYQWQKNGAAINGATSFSYTTPSETTSDNGAQFTVVVSNSAGSVTSNAATLTVNAVPPGPLTASASTLTFGNVNVGSSSTLSVTFTNSGSSNITISNVSISGPGFTANGVSAGLIVTPGQTVTLNVTFAPAATGSVTGSVSVVSNASNSPASITLSGAGVQPISHSATLTWTASTSTVIGYNVYRGTVSGGPYTKINSLVDATTTFTDTTVHAGQTYYWVVTAVDSSNFESPYSNEVSATVPTP